MTLAVTAGIGFGGSAPRGDPDFDSVVLLMHMDGSDAATTFTDSSNSGHSFTANGAQQLDTAQKKFGTASIKGDGTGDWASASDSSDFHFGTGSFTIEFFVRFSATTSATECLINSGGRGLFLADYDGWSIDTNDSGNLIAFQARQGGSGPALHYESWASSPDTWYHVAFVRNGSTTGEFFIDGTSIGTDSYAIDLADSDSRDLRIGAAPDSGSGHQSLDGWIDEVRITKGVARYTTNFTAPSAPFPDS